MPSETAAGYIKQPFVHRSIRPAVLFVVVMLMAIEFSPVRLRQHTGSSSWAPDAFAHFTAPFWALSMKDLKAPCWAQFRGLVAAWFLRVEFIFGTLS
jgi:hypothetical protein